MLVLLQTGQYYYKTKNTLVLLQNKYMLVLIHNFVKINKRKEERSKNNKINKRKEERSIFF